MSIQVRHCHQLALAGSLWALSCAFGAVPGGAAGSLVVAPTRVVLDEGTRSAEIQLVNRGTTAASYSISFTHLEMGESGSLTAASSESTNTRWADDLLRFSPRRVTLGPGESQTVRLLARRPADLPSGEYRSHLLFRAEPEAAADPTAASATGALSVQVASVLGLSIPVFVRHQTQPASVALGEIERPLPGAPPTLRFLLQRSGTRSIFGDLIVERAESRAGAEPPLAALRGVAVYAPVELRRLAVELPSDLPAATRLRVRFEDREGNSGTLAERILTLD